MNFKSLHHQKSPLVICNVWDATSAKIAEKLGFQAIGTSSAATSSMLGYNDGENMSFSELCYFVKQIKASSHLPLTVDIESGYSRQADTVAKNIQTLANLGAVGINIEDSLVNEKRTLINAELFAQLIADVVALLKDKGIDVFINVRIDTYLTGGSNPNAEAQRRVKLYQQAGVDGIFIPGIEQPDEIAKLVQCCQLPINVMCMPNLPKFEHLKALGVKRISMGNFLFDHMYQHLASTLESVMNHDSFEVIF